jgi:hypothetical protein
LTRSESAPFRIPKARDRTVEAAMLASSLSAARSTRVACLTRRRVALRLVWPVLPVYSHRESS